ncbi:hypothetical protein [Parabacteroides goldsteinii]|uniref:hypothetical protein n=1 Tax=Parabacteroides goldsteinii TaxID=328812 RepID=UPI00321A6349
MDRVCLVDGVDIFKRYGAKVTRNGYSDLLTFPPLVTPDSTSWPEEDGVEVDLMDPKLDVKEVSISFVADEGNDFVNFLCQPGYHVWSMGLGREWRLRINTQSNNKLINTTSVFTLKFIDDFPTRASDYISGPGCGVVIPKCNYEMDGVSWRDYGIIVKKGNRDEVLKSSAVKQNLSQKIRTKDGQFYDVDQVVFEAKDVIFDLYMCAENLERFWQCYDAFFNDLIQPDERILYAGYTDEEYPCYYKKSSNFKVLTLSDKVMVEFSLTLVFTSFRVNETEYILASEDDERIVCEEDGETCIDLGIAYD